MKANVDRNALTAAINIAALVMEQRNTIPILSHMAIRSAGNSLFLSGTDLDMRLEVEIEGEGDGGATTFAAPRALARVLNLGAQTVELERATIDSGKGVLGVRSGRLDLQMASLPYDDFPQHHSSPEAPAETTISTEHLDTMLRVIRACSTEETRYYLNGLYLHLDPHPSTVDAASLRAVATDGHRLYYARLAVPAAAAIGAAMPANHTQRGMIIPRKAIKILDLLRRRIDGGIQMGITRGVPGNREVTLAPTPSGMFAYFRFETRDRRCKVTLSTKLIDGTFPDYTRVIPGDGQDKLIEIERKDLRQAVDLISQCQPERTKAIKLTFDPNGGEARLRVMGNSVDGILSASTWIPAKTSVREPFTIGFNGKYLSDICRVAEGSSLMIETMDSGAPSKISSPESDRLRTVLMPMRV